MTIDERIAAFVKRFGPKGDDTLAALDRKDMVAEVRALVEDAKRQEKGISEYWRTRHNDQLSRVEASEAEAAELRGDVESLKWAGDRVVAAEQRAEAAEAEHDELLKRLDFELNNPRGLAGRLEAAEAENTKLREALREARNELDAMGLDPECPLAQRLDRALSDQCPKRSKRGPHCQNPSCTEENLCIACRAYHPKCGTCGGTGEVRRLGRHFDTPWYEPCPEQDCPHKERGDAD